MLVFLDTLNSVGIEYVSWKNNHEINDSFEGKSDLDILVKNITRSKFGKIAALYGWLEVMNPIASYPSISHFYKISKSGTVLHLHVYFDVITGESWLKEYNLPLMDFLIGNRIWDKCNNLWVLDKRTQAYIFFIRHLLVPIFNLKVLK